MTRILFVCTGNTCRSPMAEAILKNMKIEGMEVKSAGVSAVDGSKASYQARVVLEEQGIKHDHSSSFLTKELVDWADYIFTMTTSHKYMLMNQFPSSIEKVFTIKEFAFNNKNGNVSDPFGGTVEMYRETYNELNEMIKLITQKMELYNG
ncbi:low molecular weight protein arginine phosphatase [Bacillus sp. 03113]|uniref:low molecular weight protein arginine phosphatase n=1 Tax=Bacillus sp. 03113 TaxID=2578211 RepID=UPI001142AA35|nr:low molecular weight protein arginine phosphatase [Bacillus sp. 03113]